MVCESCRFCSGERPISAFRFSRSMPGGESLARARQISTMASDVLHLFQRAQQIVNQFEADGVALLRTVQRDRGDAGVVCELDRLIIHRKPLIISIPHWNSYTFAPISAVAAATHPTASARQLSATLLKVLQSLSRSGCSHQRILRKGTSTQPAQCRIKSPASRIVGGKNFSAACSGRLCRCTPISR
jgi:hypothetical protein